MDNPDTKRPLAATASIDEESSTEAFKRLKSDYEIAIDEQVAIDMAELKDALDKKDGHVNLIGSEISHNEETDMGTLSSGLACLNSETADANADVDEAIDTQPLDEEEDMENYDMFDEDLCYNSNAESDLKVCEMLRKISEAVLSSLQNDGLDDMDGPSSFVSEDAADYGHEGGNVLSYLQMSVPREVQAAIAQYLSSGSLENVHVSLDTIHYYFHVAINLRLRQLTHHCLAFCFKANQKELLTKFGDCECRRHIKNESAQGYERTQSVVSVHDESSPPQYLVAFTTEPKSKRPGEVYARIIDTDTKKSVFKREVEKIRQSGQGFACCSIEIRESPYLYLSGGRERSTQVLKYDVILGKWNKCAKLLHGRYMHMMVALKGNSKALFVLGGAEVQSIEEFDLRKNKWFERGSLLLHVVSAAYTGHQDNIYIFGGKTPTGPQPAVQCYNSTTRKMSRLADLPCAFNGGSCVVLDHQIFIATNQGHMISFDTQTSVSCLCSQHPVPKRDFTMCAKDNRIYVIGGVICNDDVTSGETHHYRFNPEKDVWVEQDAVFQSFPVLCSCVITYPQKCSVIPFRDDI
ncbi:uncharacterized protein LOC127850928 [Dreissena polymorpha]|uniref:Uncharacterized protein n=1 Tax=Dreissena polymorpha TaxID=45954 RepID=A0A9D4CYD7_DREPO|nr:uncharacterized protein LOC127850928 [Dreissena polymorpha]KAH3735778.1 hypothetical protein DPMN_042336 [Dreissena polymorpha]